MTTVDSSTRARQQAETTALRLLHDGYSTSQVSDRTGLNAAAIAQLANDFAGARPQRNGKSPEIHELPVRVLTEHPDNVRSHYTDMEELTATVAEHGVLQALLVTRGIGGRYVVIDGHRRLAAAIAANVDRVPVTVRGATTLDETLELMLVTGLQKVALDPVDEATAYGRLIDLGHTASEIARSVGKDPGHVSYRLLLLNLSDEEKAALRGNQLTLKDAMAVGRERSVRKQKHSPKRQTAHKVPHLTASHPQAQSAANRCREAEHPISLKLGPACGPCWEATIRRAALAEHANRCDLAVTELGWDDTAPATSKDSPPLSPTALPTPTSTTSPSNSPAEVTRP